MTNSFEDFLNSISILEFQVSFVILVTEIPVCFYKSHASMIVPFAFIILERSRNVKRSEVNVKKYQRN